MIDRRLALLNWKNSNGVTWSALAKQLGFDLSYIFRIASGDRPVTDGFIGRFAQVYGFPAADSIFGSCQAPCEEHAA